MRAIRYGCIPIRISSPTPATAPSGRKNRNGIPPAISTQMLAPVITIAVPRSRWIPATIPIRIASAISSILMSGICRIGVRRWASRIARNATIANFASSDGWKPIAPGPSQR